MKYLLWLTACLLSCPAADPFVQRLSALSGRDRGEAWQAAVIPKLANKPKDSISIGVPPQWGPIGPDDGKPVANKFMKVGNAALGVVVAENAVLATSRIQAPMPDGPFKGEWFKMAVITGGKLTAFEAATGVLRWTVELPAAPALDALSLDRDGNALVGLQDGSVVSVGTP